MSRADLRRELDAALAELNSRRWHDDRDPYEADIGTHSEGLAIDIRKDGEAPHKVVADFAKAAMRAGYVVRGVNVVEDYRIDDDHTRLFLSEADDCLDIRGDQARAEGFLWGIFMASLAELEGWT